MFDYCIDAPDNSPEVTRQFFTTYFTTHRKHFNSKSKFCNYVYGPITNITSSMIAVFI